MNEPKCPRCGKPLSFELGTYYCHWCRLIVNPSSLEEPVDAVEVVRCKDCKAWNRYESTSVSGNCGYLHKMRMDDDFCSYGERKDHE